MLSLGDASLAGEHRALVVPVDLAVQTLLAAEGEVAGGAGDEGVLADQSQAGETAGSGVLTGPPSCWLL